MTPNIQKDESAELRRACEAALDDLTASLTQVLKAVNRVHRTMKRLNDYAETGMTGKPAVEAEK